jgi:hypothetical protein
MLGLDLVLFVGTGEAGVGLAILGRHATLEVVLVAGHVAPVAFPAIALDPGFLVGPRETDLVLPVAVLALVEVLALALRVGLGTAVAGLAALVVDVAVLGGVLGLVAEVSCAFDLSHFYSPMRSRGQAM